MTSQAEVGDIVAMYGKQFLEKHTIPAYKQGVLRDIEHCRTAYFGGHKYACSHCGQTRIQYNSCGNRHCPKCQHLERERWIRQREADLLPVKYFHVVFTVPHELNGLFLNHQREMYNLLFTTAWSVINTFASDAKHLGAKTAMTTVLHTWGQNLSYHPHLHCIVPGGGITEQGKWKRVRNKGKFLFPVKAMSLVFRARFLEGCKRIAAEKAYDLPVLLIDELFTKSWVVYAKRPFKNVGTVVKYLARYTHRIAISNNRIKKIENGHVFFTAKNYRKQGLQELTTLTADEFLRRFCMHILPAKLRKVRHYGFLSGRKKKEYLELIRKDLQVQAPIMQKVDMKSILEDKLGCEIDLCPFCKVGKMLVVESFAKRKDYNQLE